LTGALASLPLHAAGKYDTPAAETKIYNYMISSYTPSVTALLRSSATPREFHGVFALTQAATPGLSPLPGTITEVDQVQAILKNGHKICTRVDGRDATVKAVTDGVMNHSWIHFSCHASQNAIPTKSAFHLYDGPLEIAKIVRRPPQYAELAYLSACQTASGDSKLPDESIHLAAAMIYSGFKSVVATLWSIRDDDAPLVASVFYEHLLQNPDGVAQALHAAVSQLRDKVGEKNHLAWVPFIHMGQ
jgi:CHAT domain-containing protein